MVKSTTITAGGTFEGPEWVYEDYRIRHEEDVERNQKGEVAPEVSRPEALGNIKPVRPVKAKRNDKLEKAVTKDLNKRNIK